MEKSHTPLTLKSLEVMCQRCHKRPLYTKRSGLCQLCYNKDYRKIARPNRRLMKVLDRIDKLNAQLNDAKELAKNLLTEIEVAKQAQRQWEEMF